VSTEQPSLKPGTEEANPFVEPPGTATATELASAGRAAVEALGPDAFAGYTVDLEHGAADIYVTTEQAAEAVRSISPKARALVVPLSYNELIALRDRITDDREWFSSVGLELRSWGPHVPDNVVRVGVPSFESTAVQAVNDRYGAHVQLVVDDAVAVFADGG
jgi:hypothetical protein